MNFPLADRMHAIQPFHVMELLRRAGELEAAGRDIIHMEVGEPDFPTPQPILAAAQAFLERGRVGYTAALGLPALREAIAAYYRKRFGVAVSPSRIVVTPGASGALMLAIGILTNPGDEWLMSDPGYPSNRHIVRAFEGTPMPLPVDASSRYQPTAQQVAASWSPHTCGIMIASPANPTGTLIDESTLGEIADVCQQKNGALLVDEIYQGLSYGIEASTALQRHPDALVVNSFSKYFGMTGWRLGWLVLPEHLVRAVEKLAQHFFISPSTVAQHAALAAFQPETLAVLEARRHAFAERRQALLTGLAEIPGVHVDCVPQGAFYVYANIRETGMDSQTLARRLIEEAGVATTPGLDFGDHHPGQHLRIAYTTDTDRIREACRRIRHTLAQH